jgi:hypothetical protein
MHTGEGGAEAAAYPRPTNGIWFAITVMNSTLVESGRPASGLFLFIPNLVRLDSDAWAQAAKAAPRNRRIGSHRDVRRGFPTRGALHIVGS